MGCEADKELSDNTVLQVMMKNCKQGSYIDTRILSNSATDKGSTKCSSLAQLTFHQVVYMPR